MDNRKKPPQSVIGNRRPRPEKSEKLEDFIFTTQENETARRAGRQTEPLTKPIETESRDREYNGNRRRKALNRKRIRREIAKPEEAPRRRIKPEEPVYTGGEVAEKLKKPFSNRIIRILTILLVILLLLIFGVFAYARFGNLNPGLSGNIGLYNISSNAAAVASHHRIANIAVFGVDGREDVEGDRSDTIMILSADYEHSKLKVTSLLRDTYVKIASEDSFDKLNAAYSIGGVDEAVKTINENFDTAITDYVIFDFTSLVALVNAVGGIDVDITSEDELYWLNQYLMDVNDKVKTADPDVPGTGMQHLTGSQALAYARIRYVGNGDFERTQRQRTILTQVVAKASQMGPIAQLHLVQEVMPYIKTSIRTPEMIKLGLNFILMSNKEIAQDRLPTDEYMADGYLGGVSYIFPNTLVDNIKSWYQFVYEIDYTPSETADEISAEIAEIW